MLNNRKELNIVIRMYYMEFLHFISFICRETRLIETLENVCERFLHYNVHAERPGSLRYARGRSQTMETLWNLR
jgi:hypothetical protein